MSLPVPGSAVAAVPMSTPLLGGDAGPVGWSMHYVDADLGTVVDALLTWRGELSEHVETSSSLPFEDAVGRFLPFQAPWTRELLLPCGSWTAYLNNMIGGGDPTASANVVARRLGVAWVGATSTPRFGPGHQSTQLSVVLPATSSGAAVERVLSADATDGRWSWFELGDALSFEEVARYQARRVRDRLDRALLLRYLSALGIPAGDEAAYGPGVVVQQVADWPAQRPPRTQTLVEARDELLPRKR